LSIVFYIAITDYEGLGRGNCSVQCIYLLGRWEWARS
jgi:hypothetical protein